MTTGAPQIAVVIPTLGRRPHLLHRAVTSALAQQGVEVEILVVADGAPEEPVPEAVRTNRRVAVLQLAERSGQGAAINHGVERATADWVAFLDDDDVWHDPAKLAVQHAAAVAAADPVIVSSRVLLEVNGEILRAAPPRVIESGEDPAEFAYCADWRMRVGLLQTSSLFTARTTAAQWPYAPGFSGQSDVEWILRAVRGGSVRVVQLPQVLSTWTIDDRRAQMTSDFSWRQIRDWVERSGDLLTRRAAAGVLLTGASRAPDAPRALPRIWVAAFRRGRPRLPDLAASLYLAWGPSRIRRRRRHADGSVRTA